MKEPFAGDQKHLDHFLLNYEKVVIDALLPRVPLWLNTAHLTLMTILWAVGVILFGFLATHSMNWLWGFSICIFFQHITDMLDGAVGRSRNTGLIKWGFYMDHFLDYIFMCAMVIGYSFILPSSYAPFVLLCLTLVGGFMVHTFLDFGITNDFKISFNRFGVSEIRYVFIIFNMALMTFGKDLFIKILPYFIVGFGIALFTIVYKSQQLYQRMDMDLLRQKRIEKWKKKKMLTEEYV